MCLGPLSTAQVQMTPQRLACSSLRGHPLSLGTNMAWVDSIMPTERRNPRHSKLKRDQTVEHLGKLQIERRSNRGTKKSNPANFHEVQPRTPNFNVKQHPTIRSFLCLEGFIFGSRDESRSPSGWRLASCPSCCHGVHQVHLPIQVYVLDKPLHLRPAIAVPMTHGKHKIHHIYHWLLICIVMRCPYE